MRNLPNARHDLITSPFLKEFRRTLHSTIEVKITEPTHSLLFWHSPLVKDISYFRVRS